MIDTHVHENQANDTHGHDGHDGHDGGRAGPGVREGAPPGAAAAGCPAGAALLDEVRGVLGRYLVLPSEHAAVAVTLWVAATHAQPAWAHAPRLVVRGPDKRCGKSRLLDVVEALCWQPFITINSSSAAVYRSISEDPPTLLVDEADTIFGPRSAGNEDLRGLLNGGHQRNRPAMRYNSAEGCVEAIPTFAMAALAGIGALPDTIEDRAVVVRMRRRAPDETVAPYRFGRDRPVVQSVSGRVHDWLRGELERLEDAAPVMPVDDRAADTWEPLVAVADLAGGLWPARAREALLALTADEARDGRDSVRGRLLADIHAAFGTDEIIATTTLLARLRSDPEGPWLDYGGASGLTARRLAELLRDYDIRSHNIRMPLRKQAKGFDRAQFADAWRRYTPALVAAGPAPTDPADHPADHPADATTGATTGGTAAPGGPGGPGVGWRAVPPSPPTSDPGRHTGPVRTVPSHDPAGTAPSVPPGHAVPGPTSDGTDDDGGTAPGRPPGTDHARAAGIDTAAPTGPDDLGGLRDVGDLPDLDDLRDLDDLDDLGQGPPS